MSYVNILVSRGQELLVGYSDRGRRSTALGNSNQGASKCPTVGRDQKWAPSYRDSPLPDGPHSGKRGGLNGSLQHQRCFAVYPPEFEIPTFFVGAD